MVADNYPVLQTLYSQWCKKPSKLPNPKWFLPAVIIFMILFFCIFRGCANAQDKWLITAYCHCQKCCGKSDGITASGKRAKTGYIALNWLAFGTKVRIEGLGEFTVMDRGAKSLFGTKKNSIKHIDIYMSRHSEALRFGRQYREVEILQ